MRPPTRLTLAAPLLLAAACSNGSRGGAPPPGLPAPLLARFAIDGVFDFAELPAPEQVVLEFRDQFGAGIGTGKTTTLQWSVTNDDRHLYFAFEWDDASYDHTFDLTTGPVDFDGVRVMFDVDGDGTWEAGEDARTVIAARVSSQYVDQHGAPGDETDAIGDGYGRLRRDDANGRYRAELLIPLVQDANGQDGALSASTRYTIVLMDHIELQAMPITGNATGLDGVPGLGSPSNAWRALPFAPAVVHAHQDPPTNLAGLIAFVSTHEEPLGEIYTFDPSTGTVTRVTSDPSLYKDNVSLSHDRTKIAFHGAPTRVAYAQYEIYTVQVDGTGFTQLTTNAVLDGHPAWSPDDTRIAYASFRGAPAAIVIMTAGGAELAVLTPNGVDDNDPEWLLDGRIVFKTDRFSTLPEVRIAIMDGDGLNARLLTAMAGTSDHDPVANGQIALFERFTKNTDYATDPDTGFVGWNLVEARVDGSGEQTLLADGWVNWLPVLDPSGQYIAFLKSTGAYTDIHLMTRTGTDLGRFVSGVTRATYLDWK